MGGHELGQVGARGRDDPNVDRAGLAGLPPTSALIEHGRSSANGREIDLPSTRMSAGTCAHQNAIAARALSANASASARGIVL